MTTLQRLVVPAGLAGAAAFLYTFRLGSAPAHLGWDEVFFGINGYTIATSGRDMHGAFLPLYVHYVGQIWYQPALVYLTALVFKIAPVTEATVRLPIALVAVINVVLTYVAARAIFKSGKTAFAAAGFLLMTPAHFLLGREAVDYILPLPFVLAWLSCLAAFVDRPRPWLILGGALALGLGLFSYAASLVMMPLYWGMTLLVIAVVPAPVKSRYYAEAGVFLLPLLALIHWISSHPDFMASQISRYQLYDAKRFTPLQGVKDFLNYQNMTHRMSMYWDYLGPNYLFMSGAVKMTMSTRRVGVFLMPLAVFMSVGIYRSVVERNWLQRLLVFGFATAPAAALLVDDPFAVDREMELVVFGALLAAFGLICLLEARRRLVRVATLALVVLTVVEFAAFQLHYHTAYRVASAEWFERNIRGGIEEIMRQDQQARVPRVYLNTRIPNIENYWRFYLIRHQREDLESRTQFFDPSDIDPAATAPGSLFLCATGDTWRQAQVQAGILAVVAEIPDPSGVKSFVVLRRV